MKQMLTELYRRFREYQYSRQEKKLHDKYLYNKYGIKQKGN